ncbi:hypothetical protein E3N88_06500 [Mikania micrantha]|uniref:Uncharacterized protein n=1 Tax=Mikania micrantha TaxID=192012 RepID=A0A5N6PNV5_9ASTR|nr:hypothetical protein E3N88_06500 [Mikania micrantha]
MKLGLLGSTETHRGTRWAPNWAFAVREARAGEFEFSEKRRGTRRPIIFHLRAVAWEAAVKEIDGGGRRLWRTPAVGGVGCGGDRRWGEAAVEETDGGGIRMWRRSTKGEEIVRRG